MAWPFGKKCPYCGSKNITIDKENNALICNECDKVSKLGEEEEEEVNKKKDKEEVIWTGLTAYILNLWKIIFLIPVLLFVYWSLFLYAIPSWIPYAGESTVVVYLSNANIGSVSLTGGGVYLGGFATIGGAILLILVFHMFYSGIYKEKFSFKKYFVRLILQVIAVGILYGILTFVVPNAPAGYEFFQQTDFGCFITNNFNSELCKTSQTVVEATNKIGGSASYASISFKVGIKELNYKIGNPEAGEKYKLYFTLTNGMDKKIEDVTISVKAGNTGATVSDCSEDSPCELEEGENAFSAEFESIPETMVSFKPTITVKYPQSVEGTNKFKIIWSENAYNGNYKPICAEEENQNYYCPSTTEGPVDVTPSFIGKQIVSEEENQKIDFIVRVSNGGSGYARLSNAKINQETTTGYEVSISCPDSILNEFTLTPKGSTATAGSGVYKQYKDFDCDITIPYKLSGMAFSKEITVKVSFDYNYIYQFTGSSISVIS